MSIPEEIRKIKRPTNTIVKKIGNKYAVIQRVGCKRKNGKNLPVNGSVIGHIINGMYVPKKVDYFSVAMKTYGDFALAKSLSSELLAELEKVYGAKTASDIYAIALLRAISPDLKDHMIEDEYEESFLSEDMKGLRLSKTRISKLVNDIGKDYSKVLKFIRNRTENIDTKNLIAIDGMLKGCNGRINSLGDFSYKSRIKGSKDISIIVAFDVTTKEIVCSLPYAGNCLDITGFPDFIVKSGIKRGIIVGDKGMNDGSGIHGMGYIFPLKRSRKILDEVDIYDMDERLGGRESPILCKKVEKGGRFYYGFRDLWRAAKEKSDYVTRHRFTAKGLKEKERKFGTVVYVSDHDMTCAQAYELYRQRWEIELVNRFYKNILSLDTVREHDDYSIYGNEFLNMLSSIIGNRMKNAFEKIGLFEKYTYRQLMKIMKRYKKIRMPDTKNWMRTQPTKSENEIYTMLNI